MRVRCVDNAYRSLPTTSVYYTAESRDATFSLQIGKEYVVYAIWGNGKEILYSLLDSEYATYPKWFPAMLFDVTDARLATCWQFAPERSSASMLPGFLIAFPEWLRDPSFNTNVVEGDLATQDIWQRYRRHIDSESTKQ